MSFRLVSILCYGNIVSFSREVEEALCLRCEMDFLHRLGILRSKGTQSDKDDVHFRQHTGTNDPESRWYVFRFFDEVVADDIVWERNAHITKELHNRSVSSFNDIPPYLFGISVEISPVDNEMMENG